MGANGAIILSTDRDVAILGAPPRKAKQKTVEARGNDWKACRSLIREGEELFGRLRLLHFDQKCTSEQGSFKIRS